MNDLYVLVHVNPYRSSHCEMSALFLKTISHTYPVELTARVIMVDAKTAILTWSLSGSVENVYKADLLNSGSASGAAPLVTAFHSTPFSVKGKFTSEISFNPSNITSLLAGNMAAIEVLTTTVCHYLMVKRPYYCMLCFRNGLIMHNNVITIVSSPTFNLTLPPTSW